jgi:hypothetical protein
VKRRTSDSFVNDTLTSFAGGKAYAVVDRLAAVRAVIDNGKPSGTLNRYLEQIRDEVGRRGNSPEQREARELAKIMKSSLGPCVRALSSLLH